MKKMLMILFCVICASQYQSQAQYIPDANTVALWHFDELNTIDTVRDASGNNNYGIPNGTTIVDGKFGKARRFNGYDHIVIPDSPSLNLQNQFTVEAWVSIETIIGQAGVIIDKGSRSDRNYEIGILADGRISGGTHNSTGEIILNVPYIIQNEVFYHIALVADGSFLKLFVNDTLIGQVEAPGPYTTYTSDLGIGYNLGNDDYYFQGIIDEVRISNIARTNFQQYEYTTYPNKHTLTYTDTNTITVMLSPGKYETYATFDSAYAGGVLDGIFFLSHEKGYAKYRVIHSNKDTLVFSDTTYGVLFFANHKDSLDNHGEVNVYFVPFDTVSSPLSVSPENRSFPFKISLRQNYPNPFNPSTTIEYQLPNRGDVQIRIYNSIGQLVKTLLDDNQQAGNYSVVWNGKNDNGLAVSSGAYYYEISTNGTSEAKKMILLK